MLFDFSGLLNSLKNINSSLKNVTGTYYNSLFFLTVGSGEVILDPDTGNYSLATTKLIELKGRLLQKKLPNLDLNGGSQDSRIYLEGWLTIPLEYRNSIIVNFNSGGLNYSFDCKILQNDIWETGKFYFANSIPQATNELVSLKTALGQRIKGYFEKNQS